MKHLNDSPTKDDASAKHNIVSKQMLFANQNNESVSHNPYYVFYHQHYLYTPKPKRTRPNDRDLYKFTTPNRKPFLFGLKAKINNQDINILLDPGSTITMMSKNLEAKLDQTSLKSRGSKTMILAVRM